jgi:1,4-alpha-glucan branching enzyme
MFIFIGDGPLLSYLIRLSQRLHLTEQVRFTGFVTNTKIPRYLAMADLCVIPSVYEPFGLIALESLASETPILSSGRGGLAEIHEKVAGFPIINPLTPRRLIQLLEEQFKNPQRMTELGKVGRKLVAQQFSWRHSAARTEQVLQKIREKAKKN